MTKAKSTPTPKTNNVNAAKNYYHQRILSGINSIEYIGDEVYCQLIMDAGDKSTIINFNPLCVYLHPSTGKNIIVTSSITSLPETIAVNNELNYIVQKTAKKSNQFCLFRGGETPLINVSMAEVNKALHDIIHTTSIRPNSQLNDVFGFRHELVYVENEDLYEILIYTISLKNFIKEQLDT